MSDAKPFRLTSGNMSPIYIDCRLLISYPEMRDLITGFAHWFYKSKGLHADYIAGGETAGISYAAWLAERLNKPFVYVRKQPKKHGTSSQIEGELKPRSVVLLYEDLITNGESKLNFLQGIRNAGANVKDCIVVFDRQQGGEGALSMHGVLLYSLTNLKTALDLGREYDYISNEEFDSVKEYLCNRRLWHKARGFVFHE